MGIVEPPLSPFVVPGEAIFRFLFVSCEDGPRRTEGSVRIASFSTPAAPGQGRPSSFKERFDG